MTTLIDSPEFTTDEIYEIQSTDPVQGASASAAFSGIGYSNQPHQQLANRTAFLKGRQDANIANIAALLGFQALFSSTLNSGGNSLLRIGVQDTARGLIDLVVQFGYFNLGASTPISADTEYAVTFLEEFPNAILCPPLLTNVYVSTSGRNTVASVLNGSWTTSGFTLVFDVPNGASGSFTGNERTNGVSYFAIGF